MKKGKNLTTADLEMLNPISLEFGDSIIGAMSEAGSNNGLMVVIPLQEIKEIRRTKPDEDGAYYIKADTTEGIQHFYLSDFITIKAN